MDSGPRLELALQTEDAGEPVALAVPWGTDGSGDALAAAQVPRWRAADSFIALRKGGQRLRNSWWGGPASSLPSQLLAAQDGAGSADGGL